eukprot:6767950-Lingulodinium_polyedra.AAC.1
METAPAGRTQRNRRRLLWAHLELGDGTYLIGSAYLLTGCGLAELNVHLLAEVGSAVQASVFPALIGGDWNLETGEVSKSGLLEKAGM